MKRETKKKIAGILVLLLFLIVTIVIYVRVGKPMTELVKDSDRFRAWVAAHGWKSRLLFMAMVCLQVVVAIIPGEPLELAAGYVFGTVEGTLLCLGGIVAGSVIVFGMVRLFGRRFVEIFFSKDKIDSLKIMQNPKRLFTVTAILMILPGTPKDLLTYCAGLTQIPFGAWLLICSVGRIPSVVTSTLCAHMIASHNYLLAAVVFAVTVLLCGAGLWVYAKMKSGKEKKSEP